MDNVIKIRILGNEFKVISPDGEEHAKKVAYAVEQKTREIITDDSTAPTTKVALIAAMDFCEEEMKYHRIATKMKKRLAKYEEEVSRLSRANGEEEYIEEITSLEEKIALLEKEAKEKDEEIALLRDDNETLIGFRKSLIEKEKEVESLISANAELEKALFEKAQKVAELEEKLAFLEEDEDDFFEEIDQASEKNEEAEAEEAFTETEAYDEEEKDFDDDEDIIIPGYLDGADYIPSDDEYGESQIENPFGLNFGEDE